MLPQGPLSLAIIGSALIALSFGLSRFAFGLFVPTIRESLLLSPSIIGLVAAQAYTGFALASVLATRLAERFGARRLASAATLSLCTGFLLIALAQGAWLLGVGVLLCGMSTGLMMPALSMAVRAEVPPQQQGRANAAMNAATGVGIVFAVVAVFALGEAWRVAYVGFAVLGVLALVAAWMRLPEKWSPAQPQYGPFAPRRAGAFTQLAALAFGMGVVSSVYWVFAPDLLVALGSFPGGGAAWLWLAVGLAGLVGGFAGDLLDRWRGTAVHAVAMSLLVAALAVLALAPQHLGLAVLSAAMFGLAYMTLTGIYLVDAIRLAEARPARGAVLAFVATTLGQAIGASLSGLFISEMGYVATFMGFAAFGVLLVLASPWFPLAPLVEPET